MGVVRGYGKPPWVFKGRAHYQLNLVKTDTARALIPKDFRLVEAFGYTLGGFFLASYDDSPAGIFDELVVIAGLIWNQSRSCAWAGRVLVNSEEACVHGREAVGLPSHAARFLKRRQQNSSKYRFLDMIGLRNLCGLEDQMDVQVIENNHPAAMDLCTIHLSNDAAATKFGKGLGPAIKLSLPSFSGRTKCNPNLLKYSCKIECRVRPVKPVKVTPGPVCEQSIKDQSSEDQSLTSEDSRTKECIENERNLCISVMLSKPILAFEFNSMKMEVDAPVIIPRYPGNSCS